MKRLLGVALLAVALIFVSPGCYTLRSSAIPADMRTINIAFFPNEAQLVVPTLSQTFTEALKSRVRTTTRLSMVNGDANANMSGSIVGYSIAPVSIQSTNPNTPPIAGAEVLTISVRVKFVFNTAKDASERSISFEQVFTQHKNFSGDINTQETGLIQDITKLLVDDIFNKAFNNW